MTLLLLLGAGITLITPADRIFGVEGETRVLPIGFEARVFGVEGETRIEAIAGESRVYAVIDKTRIEAIKDG